MQTTVLETKSAAPESVVASNSKPNGMARPEYIFGLPKAARPATIDVEITPEIAATLLAMRPRHQRPIRPARVRSFRELIQAGQFIYTHQGLAFDVDGHLIDGQHRLTAIVAEVATVVLQATFGLPIETFSALDRGAGRTVADDMITDGQVESPKEAHTMSAATRILSAMASGNRAFSHRGLGTWTLQKAAAAAAGHEHLLTGSRLAQSLPRGIPKGPFAAAWALFAERDKKLADEFATKLITGENISRGHPIYHLREWCLKLSKGNTKHKTDDFMFRSINTWNAMRQKRNITVLRGAIGEAPTYPKII